MDKAEKGTTGTVTISRTPRYCSVCGKDMVDPVTGAAFIGMEFILSAQNDSDLAFFKKQLGVYGDKIEKNSPLVLDLCWECWFKALDIPLKE